MVEIKGKQMPPIETYYDKKASSYDAVCDTLYFKVYDAVTWRYLEPYVPSSPEAVVLDAGGGTGRWSIRMAKKGCRVVLVDISEGMLNVAREKIIQEGLQNRIEIRKGDITELSFPDNTFDLVLCEHTLFLFKEQDKVVRELVRVLKTKAPLVISAQNRYAQTLAHLDVKPVPENMRRALNILTCQEHDTMTPDGMVKIHSLTPNEFQALLERNGLQVEKIICKGVTTPLRFSPKYILKKEYSKDILDNMLQLELAFCEKRDALALAGHLQAIAYKI